MKKNPQGFSLIELLLAGAIFLIFITGVVEILISGLETDHVGEGITIATEYATEGMEAVRSIGSENFDNIEVVAASGLRRVNDRWAFSGSDNTNGKYTRVIAVTGVHRDGDGNIDEHGGNDDADTKKVTVTVTWDVTSGRSSSVVLETFFTRWKK